MRNKAIPFCIILTLLVSSCSTVNLTARKGKDIPLTSADSLKLKGIYSQQPIDTNRFHSQRVLFENFTFDTLGRKQNKFSVDIIPNDSKTLTVHLLDNDVSIINLTLKGKYKNGYFKVNRNYRTEFIAGPLLWVLAEHLNYIGLTKDNNLVVLNSGGVGVLMLVVFPFFVAGGDRHDYEYHRIK